jgi:hypothetical protein
MLGQFASQNSAYEFALRSATAFIDGNRSRNFLLRQSRLRLLEPPISDDSAGQSPALPGIYKFLSARSAIRGANSNPRK